MMQWENGRLSDNVDDATQDQQQQPTLADVGMRAGMAGAGLMLLSRGKTPWAAMIALVLIFFALIGFNSLRRAENRVMQTAGLQAAQTPLPQSGSGADPQRMRFVSAILAETEDVWSAIYRAQGKTYQEPGLILYHTAIRSACGTATTAIGPFYCPNDGKIYLDERFFDQLSKDFGAPGEFASAYVIAHEVGHHIQDLDGTLAAVDKQRDAAADEKTVNILTERLELQADCYAGIWANHMKSRGVADGQDISLALNAAHKIGDDNLQQASQGYAVPDSFTHGTSAQRVYWFTQGLKTGSPKACNTITGKI